MVGVLDGQDFVVFFGGKRALPKECALEVAGFYFFYLFNFPSLAFEGLRVFFAFTYIVYVLFVFFFFLSQSREVVVACLAEISECQT